MELVFIRHGETKMNEANLYQGTTDVPIGERGMEQLSRAPVHTGVRRVFSSPMLRARQTAAALFPNAQLVLVSGLREMDFGDFEGKSGEELANWPEYKLWKQGGYDAACPGGESIREVCARVTDALDLIVREAGEDERVYIVAHGAVIANIMSAASGDVSTYFTRRIKNLHGYRVAVDKEDWLKNRRFTSSVEYSAAAEE